MGAWGAGIFSDDTAADVRDDFKELTGGGLDAEEATRRLLEQWAETLADPDEAGVFWLALAATQSSMGRLQDAVRDRAVDVIDSGSDLRRWEEDADPADVRKRRANLAKLREELVGVVLLGQADVQASKPRKGGLFGRSRDRRPERIPHLTWWKHLDAELAEHWQVT